MPAEIRVEKAADLPLRGVVGVREPCKQFEVLLRQTKAQFVHATCDETHRAVLPTLTRTGDFDDLALPMGRMQHAMDCPAAVHNAKVKHVTLLLA